MIITGSTLQLDSSHQLSISERRHETLEAWRDDPGGRRTLALESTELRQLDAVAGSTITQVMTTAPSAAPTALPDPGASAAAARLAPQLQPAATDAATEATVGDLATLRISLLKMLVERFTGQRIDVAEVPPPASGAGAPAPDVPRPDDLTPAAVSDVDERVGWGVDWRLQLDHIEQEHTTFQARGVVHTADGQDISLAVDLSMSRRFESHLDAALRAGDAPLKDPLVINFGGTAAELTQTRFAFDIDADGRADQIAFVSPGSGFLALDRNGDGRINDGGELFGALSGDGFADLAAFDEDGNGWIDERDAVFGKLLIWSRGADGTDTLAGLAERDIGAIWLGNVATPFQIRDAGNTLQGAVRATGLYLRESGGAGTLQQLDLVA